ncbi:MAG: copper amine oxidase N-terminal domain-containing protein [Clostridia bacterium]|nr:copper amine oxidase N-terminal domain-containing protein [Clostridia bacterium]
MSRKVKYLLVFSLLLVFIGLLHASAYASDPSVALKVYASGKKVEFSDVQPYFSSGKMYIPIKDVLATGEITVRWDADKKVMSFTRGSHNVAIDVLRDTLSDKGQTWNMDFEIKDGRMCVPIREFYRALDMTFRWLPDSQEVRICILCLDLED